MNYNYIVMIVSSFLLGGCLINQCPKLFVAEHNQDAYSLRVRPYDANMKTFTRKPDYPEDFCYVDFFMIVQNVTDNPLYLPEEWGTGGYSSVEIDIRKKDGMLFSLKKREGIWYRNFPSRIIILPYSMLAYPISLDEGIWDGLPPLEIGEEVWIRARLWMGHTKIDGKMGRVPYKNIESAWTPVIIKEKRTAHISEVDLCK